MQHQRFPYKTATQRRLESEGSSDRGGIKQKHDSKTTVEGWEQCLRMQITKHPRTTLGIGLVAGLLVGWWVKR